MKTLKIDELRDNPGHYSALARVLEKGGLLCIPCSGSYRIIASFLDQSAVTSLMASKRRTKKAPSLVFIGDRKQLSSLTDDVDPVAKKMAKELWPGPLTILFEPSEDLPRKITKQVALANKHIGVRIPDDTIMQNLLDAFGGPVLVSSANRQKKAGASSPAQVRKNFVHLVDIFVDAGDLQGAHSSTVVEVKDGAVHVTRDGCIEAETLQKYNH